MHVENPVSASDTYLITVRGKKKKKPTQEFKYEGEADFIQIRV